MGGSMAKDILETAAETPTGKPDWAMSRRERRAADRTRQGLPPPRRRWPWVILVLLALAAAGAWAFRDRLTALAPAPEEAAMAAPEAPPLTQINSDEWTRLEPVTLRRTVKVIGTLQPSRRVDLSAEAAGQVETIEVRPGDAVTQGQVLVQIDVERLGLDLNLARSNAEATRSQLALAEQQLERQEALVERGVAAATTLDEVRTNVDALRANLSAQQDQISAAELSLARATVRAPFDGVVASRAVEPGAVVGAGTALLSVVDLHRMEMLGAAPVSAGAVLATGQEVDLNVDGIEGREFTGTVARIAPVAEEGTRTITVYVALDNEDGTLLGGMFATGGIVVDEARDALALPRAALREEDGDHVLALEDGTLVRRDVEVGAEWPGGLVQVEGLEAGAQVVTADLPDLQAGEPVELVDF
jgi:membrane fusion protein (multidrug efflux system)